MSKVFEYDHAVVGAGTVGSWTALQLVRMGKKVLLLEQFSDLHTRGSSHGQSRIIRSSYEDECFAQLMPHALRMWSEVMLETGHADLMQTTGLLHLTTTESGVDQHEKSVRNMRKFCPEALETDPDAIRKIMEGRLVYDDLRAALLDKTGGVLRAHKCVRVIQTLFKERGGDLWDESPVQRIQPVGDTEVQLYLDSDRVVSAKSVVVCAGAWTAKLLKPFVTLPAKAQVVRVYYWKEKEPGAYSIQSGFPTMLDNGTPEVYSLPSLEYPGMVKVCIHGGVDCDPDLRDQTPQNPELLDLIKKYVRDHFPLLESEEPAIVEICMYTVTPDEKFIMDTVPQHKNIVFGTGFSGTGFKCSPVTGRLLSQLATGTEPFLDISAFRLSRFEK